MNKIASNARLKASLEELARFGCPVDLSVAVTEVEDEKVELEQVGGITESCLFELEDGRVACMAYIAATNQTSRTIDLYEVELRTPWDNGLLEWLLPTQIKFQIRGKPKCTPLLYRFPGSGLEFAYNEVINHYLVERKRLPGQRRLEGWFLAMGGRMPGELRHGQEVDLDLTIIAADHAEYSTTLRFWTERILAPRKIAKARRNIFATPAAEEAMPPRDISRVVPLATQPPASD
jgi:hypothetical protein